MNEVLGDVEISLWNNEDREICDWILYLRYILSWCMLLNLDLRDETLDMVAIAKSNELTGTITNGR
jgi:hypothetical protein